MEINENNNSIEQTPENTNEEKYLVFTILGKQYTIPSKFIGEIALFDTVYPQPLMPPYVLGVINRYSVPYALFDIGLMLFKTPSPQGKVLVIKENIDRVAFLIDDVTGIADIPQDNLLEIEQNMETGGISDIISASFNWNESDVLVLDIYRILARVSSEAV
jgi:purine-binding chemotaxis protein CheW